MREHQTSNQPGKGSGATNATPTPGKRTLTDGLAAGPAKSDKKADKKPAGKKPKTREYTMWVHQWVQVVNPAQVLDLEPDGTAAGTGDSIPAGKRGKVVAEVVDGPIQVELTDVDRETGQLRRVWIQRDDATLVLEEDDDQVSTDPDRNTAVAQAGSKKTKATVEAVQHLGEWKSLGDGFCATAGKLVEALVPDLGDSSKLVLRANIPVSGGLLSVSFTGSVERDNMVDDDQYKIRLEFAMGYGVSHGAWIFKAFVEAGVFGYIEASGDTGKETFDLLTYALARGVAHISQDAADAVFGGGRAAIEKTMDREDYAQIGAGVRGSASLEAGSTKVGASAEASISARHTGTGAKGSETGKVVDETIVMGQAGLGWTTDDLAFAGGAAVTAGATSGTLLAVNAAAAGTKSFDLAELGELVTYEKGARVLAAYGADALAAIGPIIAVVLEQLGLSASQKSIDQHLAKTAANLTGARVLAALATTHMAKQLGGLTVAAPMSYEVGIEFEWKPGIGVAFSIQLKRISAIEMGTESGEAGRYYKVENATRILKIQANNQGFTAE